MLEEGARAAMPILEVLPGQSAHRFAGVGVGNDVAAHVDARTGSQQALIELGVLVGDRVLVEQPHTLENAAAKSPRPNALDESFFAAAAVLRTTNPHRAAKSRSDAPLEEVLSPRLGCPADVVRACSRADRDALAHEVHAL